MVETTNYALIIIPGIIWTGFVLTLIDKRNRSRVAFMLAQTHIPFSALFALSGSI